MSQSTERLMDDEVFSIFLDVGLSETVTYRRLNGEIITTVAEIDVGATRFGDFQAGTNEYRASILLKKSDIDEPKRGDVVVDSAGVNYKVQDIDPDDSDRSLVRVYTK